MIGTPMHRLTSAFPAMEHLGGVILFLSWLVAGHARSSGGPAGRHASGCSIFMEYVPSVIEQEWVDNILEWQHDEYCNIVNRYRDKFSSLGQAIKSMEQAFSNNNKWGQDTFLSKYHYSYNCMNGSVTRWATVIEPLVAALRHPLALCGQPGGRDDMLLSRDYIVLTSHSAAMPQSGSSIHHCNAKHKSYLFDLGASTYLKGSGGASQKVMLDSYKERGITFDRMLLWEAGKVDPAELFAQLPDHLFSSYQVRTA